MMLWFSDGRIALTELNPGDVEVLNLITDIFNSEVMTVRQAAGQAPVVYLVDLRNEQNQAKYRLALQDVQDGLPAEPGRSQSLLDAGAGHAARWAIRCFACISAADSQEIEDGLTLRFEEKMTQSGQMFRLPSGYKALYWQFEIEGWAFIDAIHAASSPRELRGV